MTHASKSKAPSRARRIERGALAVLLAVSLPMAGILTGIGATAANAAGSASALAAGQRNDTPKSEVVYANLSSTGVVDDVYVVNIMEPAAPGAVTDFGAYESVENLTDASDLAVSGDSVTMDISGESFSYQGALSASALPWNIELSYKLDGVPVAAEELGGASGAFELEIRTTRNSAVTAGYFDNYLMQISLTLPADKAKDVVASDAQIARAGSALQLTFMAMPEKDGTFTVRANVSDFEMEGISFAAIPLALAIEAPNADELVAGFDQLAAGVSELASGSSSLAAGASDLAAGASDLAAGADGVASGAQGLASGAGQIASGANSVSAGISGVTVSLQQIVDGARGVSSGLSVYQQALVGSSEKEAALVVSEEELAASLQNAFTSFMTAYSVAYSSAYVPAYLQEQAAGADAQSAAASAAASAARAAMTDAGVLQAMGSVQAAVQTAAESAGHEGAARALLEAASGLGDSGDAASLLGGAQALASGLALLQPGMETLASGAAGLADGAGQAASGATSFSEGTSSFASGAHDLASGAGQLSDGAASLDGGIQTLSTEVQAMPAAVKTQINDMMASYDKSDYVPESFVSDKNTQVKLVQFVITSAAITAPEPAQVEQDQDEMGFIDRLLALFR